MDGISADSLTAVAILVLVGWVAVRLAIGLLQQAGVNLGKPNTVAASEQGDDAVHHHDGATNRADDHKGH